MMEHIEREANKSRIFSYEDSMVIFAQNFISGTLMTKASRDMTGLVWGSESLNLEPDEYGLIVPKGKKRVYFTFTKAELIEGYGSRKWKERLLGRIDKILNSTKR